MSLPSSASRRRFVQSGLWGAAALALSQLPTSAWGADDAADEQLIPFLDPQPIDPNKATLHWHELKDWITPKDQFFNVSHYGTAKVPAEYALDITGHVDQPKTLTLDQVKALPKKDVTATLECSGNGSSTKFCGAIGNAKWSGASLADLLKSCGIAAGAIEVAFYGHDKGKEKIRGGEYEQHFARALSIADATSRPDLILAYEMNGEPLTVGHGAPLRLVVPGWYGIAWVKWLKSIEVRDHRLMTRFMAKDYVTLRGEELPDGTTAWKESSVGPMNIKSFVAKVVKRADGSVKVMGAAWSGLNAVKAVEVKVDEGDWVAAKIDDAHQEPYTWRFWSFDWKDPKPGEHTITSRAIDANATIQPAADDPAIKLKKTYWEANQQWPRKVRL